MASKPPNKGDEILEGTGLSASKIAESVERQVPANVDHSDVEPKKSPKDEWSMFDEEAKRQAVVVKRTSKIVSVEKDEDIPMKKRRERKSGSGNQNISSHGTAFPCEQCSFSYWNKSSYLHHVKLHKEKQSTISLQSNKTRNDAPTSTGRANVQLAENCSFCARSFATKAALAYHVIQDHQNIMSTNKQGQKRDSAGMEKKKPSGEQISERTKVIPSKVTTMVKANTEVKIEEDTGPAEDAPFIQKKPFRASTQAVIRGLPTFSAQNSNQVIPRPMEQVKHSGGMIIDYKPAALRRTSEQSLSRSPVSSDFTSISKQPPRVASFTSSGTDDKIEKSGLPLSTAIFTRAVQDPKELMIVWTEALENDMLVAASLNPEQAILCIKALNIGGMKEKQRELIKRGNWFYFSMLDEHDSCVTWTVISFSDNNPLLLKNKLFRSYPEIERIFSEHAEGRGMVINNIMRYERYGLYPQLSQSLVQKKMAFN